MNEQMLNDLEQLAILFRDGGWRHMEVQGADFSLLFSMDPEAGLEAPAPVQTSPAADTRAAVSVTVVQAAPSQPAPTPTPTPVAAPAGAVDPAWHAVTAPNLGTFYRSPKPGSPPFVEVGQQVEPGTELCLLEVMKLFTSVNAGVAGKVAQVCAADAELVDGGQVLFYIQQD